MTGDAKNGRSILVVDDHKDTAMVFARLLYLMGHRVTIAGSCAQAREAAEACAWDFQVLFCDVGLPDGDGAELLRAFKQRCGCLTVAVTGYVMQEDMNRYAALGIDHCLAKPCGLDELRRVMDQALQGTQSDGQTPPLRDRTIKIQNQSLQDIFTDRFPTDPKPAPDAADPSPSDG